jgi:serine/threonine-protein kinase
LAFHREAVVFERRAEEAPGAPLFRGGCGGILGKRMTDLSDKDLPRPGTLVGGRYEVLRVLGVGGMGVVVAARHTGQGSEVALKMLQPSAARDGESVGRFLREGRAASVLRSPHAVRLLDFGETEDGAPFLAMELLRGQDLSSYLEARGPMPLGEAARLLLQACHALEEAHGRGIVHRDLKPSNLFLVEQEGQPPLLKVLDFGISKFMGADEMHASLTGTQTTLGTPLYMSPEQVRNAKRVDTRTDVWSLGVLLQELLTGRPPFEATSFSGLCAAIIADPPAPIREAWPEVPPEIEDLLARCLEKDPSRRLASVAEFSAILAPHAGVQIAPAPRTSSRISLGPEDATVAAPAETLPPTDRAPANSPAASSLRSGGSQAVSLAGVASSPRPSRTPSGTLRRLYPLAALLLLPLGAFALWSRFSPVNPLPAASGVASISSGGEPPPAPPPARSEAPAAPSASLSSAPTADPPAAVLLASASAASRPPAPPASRPPATRRPEKGYSPTSDDRK